MPYIESFEEFCSRQNCNHITLSRKGIRNDGCQILFRNGAMSDGTSYHCEPSEDDYERLKAQARYHSTKIERLAGQFFADRRAIQEQLDWAKKYNGNVAFHIPGTEATQHLKTVKNKMRIQEGHYEKIQEQLQQTPKGKQDAELRQLEEQEKAELQMRLHQTTDELRHI